MTEGDKKSFIKLYWSLWDDKRLSGNEKLVLISLLRHYNAEKRRAWPSLNTIAEECDFSRVVVWQTLKTLETKGFVRTEKEAGKVTRYELFEDGEPIKNLNGYTHSESKQVIDTPVQNLNTPHSESEQVPIKNLNGTHSESEHELDKRTRSIRTRSIELEKQPRAREADFEADFEEFWKAYPKPKNPDKTPGRQKYVALRKKGVSADDLLKAAQNYAQAMRGTDPRYIKHCKTFLGPSDAWRDYLQAEEPKTAQQAHEDGEAEYMRDATAAGLFSLEEYRAWRAKNGF